MSTELPDTGKCFEGLLPPVVTVFTLADYVNPAAVDDVLRSPDVARVAVRMMISILLLAPDQILVNWSFREPSLGTPIGFMNRRSR